MSLMESTREQALSQLESAVQQVQLTETKLLSVVKCTHCKNMNEGISSVSFSSKILANTPPIQQEVYLVYFLYTL